MMNPNDLPTEKSVPPVRDESMSSPDLKYPETRRIFKKIQRYQIYLICNVACFILAAFFNYSSFTFWPSQVIAFFSAIVVIINTIMHYVLIDKNNKANKELSEISMAETISISNAIIKKHEETDEPE